MLSSSTATKPMPRKSLTFAAVRRIALALPGVEESTAYGSPAFKVRGKLLACIPIHRSAEPGSLVVCVDFPDRDALLAEAPATYYVTNHYIPYRSVLVRLSHITPAQLRDLLATAHKFLTRKPVRAPPTARSAQNHLHNRRPLRRSAFA